MLSPDLYDFLNDLRENNNREWFAENKKRYEEVFKKPLENVIEEFSPLLGQLSPHFRAIPKGAGSSMFRIYRDTRFSKNKDPYKTWAALRFRHASGKDGVAPGFYIHMAPGNTWTAAGLWQPESAALRSIRQAIDSNPSEWHRVKDAVEEAGLKWGGASLKRAPKGFDPDHPDIVDLRRKDFVVVKALPDDALFAPDLLPRMAQEFGYALPLVRYIGDKVGLPV